METIFVKPKAGLKIRRPETKAFLAEAGEKVPKNTFWARRLADGDVIEAVEPKQEQKQKDVAEPMAEESVEEGASAKKGGGRK